MSLDDYTLFVYISSQRYLDDLFLTKLEQDSLTSQTITTTITTTTTISWITPKICWKKYYLL